MDITDGQSEREIQILENMLHCCILEFKGNWEKFLPLMEFAYNNSYQSSIKMAPYEALYGRKCITPLYWIELSEKAILSTDLICETEEKVKEKVLCFGQKGKLSPRFIGPYEIIERIEPVAYCLALPSNLRKFIMFSTRYRSDPSHVISSVDVEL
ncbi:Retrotransposon protein, Ty3-gypsy subclass [Gossypium australe]|uniref:Retrotransposon protein, Ty3-gypsy subclass n=1 Tax=Gossypium australe TaxID=47621 RepID=A0A5B6WS21_9ROSI|nr:Retrotransposon protein, Ty3-gypsy subclass [Gossypium australe]